MATKKTTKKPAKKVAKRKYTRKVPVTFPSPPQELDSLDVPMGFSAAEMAVSPPSNEEILRAIDVIDMRQMDAHHRFNLLSMLAHHGYIPTCLGSLIDDIKTLEVGLMCEALRLQHTNRLVSPCYYANIEESERIGIPHMHVDVAINFDQSSARPGMIESNGVLYEQVI